MRYFPPRPPSSIIPDYALLQFSQFYFSTYPAMSHSSSWSSKIGFVLAAAGSAIGLGAIWKFPYTAGTNGGAIFVLLFVIFTIIVALPVQLAEFYIGRTGGKNAIDSFKTLRPGSLWPWVGRIGVAACFILLSFYSVVGGWVLNYVVHSFTGEIAPNVDFGALFEKQFPIRQVRFFIKGCSC